jgi:hypothetical protein
MLLFPGENLIAGVLDTSQQFVASVVNLKKIKQTLIAYIVHLNVSQQYIQHLKDRPCKYRKNWLIL